MNVRTRCRIGICFKRLGWAGNAQRQADQSSDRQAFHRCWEPLASTDASFALRQIVAALVNLIVVVGKLVKWFPSSKAQPIWLIGTGRSEQGSGYDAMR